MENILFRLVRAYKEEGYEVSVGLNPIRESINGQFAYIQKEQPDCHTCTDEKSYSYPALYLRQGKSRDLKEIIVAGIRRFFPGIISGKECRVGNAGFVQTAGGISVDEIYFLSLLLERLQPDTGFFIGIAFGWSTLAIGLLSPRTHLYGIDNLSEGEEAAKGFDLAVKIGKKLDLNLDLSVGTSPDDIPALMEQVSGTIDFSFIDGKHTDEQIIRDFTAILPYLSERCVVLFHDVAGVGITMLDGWNRVVSLAETNGFSHAILRRTASGMGIVYRGITPGESEVILGFVQRNGFYCPI